MAELYYQGHGSFRITAADGVTIYVDPFAGGGYDRPADLILVTHDHHDHNRVDLVPQRQGCEVITFQQALAGGVYHSFDSHGVQVQAVRAANANHDPACCVGFLLTVDGRTVYAAGDTSTTEEMRDLAARHLDWALLPIDGVYNMDPEEASQAARLIGAARTVPIHMKPGALFDEAMAARFCAPGKTVLRPGETAVL
ncbi:MBL fold metallo-hydrolase [Anaerofilum sp. BX8]|uniref:MBL fold metallo-hydrolase n=1 Tax=Anaerofilum hominis TaxID=2763016 RepID=A0A923L2A6_9FIRM|nr:MBL fold metallo-hydrolase [Anaerofilum hominis]MBC5582522.1 MBL fold metallo-hydrolase [Anaerofilum hominis]